ncbi:hypothetical protein SSP35_09_00390 [Streptomyces sp. NBRC 110611]|uniref:hypothetical protein n=1 Tax=Streptomyces sp. NBRC 110611 TaxID=1621259 RepID=UPI0008366B09|nr:hypothetical protein [Streptomyces sp. NBRC 110611]GAU68796.1 hypothetical protein SSP35_09_00390 [Streptomyces sp. NBRC 110611]
MLTRKHLAVVTGIVGGLVVTFAGHAQASAGSPATNCVHDLTGSYTCFQRNSNVASEHGKYTVQQSQDCAVTRPLPETVDGLLNTGSTAIGPSTSCSNHVGPQQGAAPNAMG